MLPMYRAGSKIVKLLNTPKITSFVNPSSFRQLYNNTRTVSNVPSMGKSLETKLMTRFPGYKLGDGDVEDAAKIENKPALPGSMGHVTREIPPWVTEFFNELFVDWRNAGVGLVKSQFRTLTCIYIAIGTVLELAVYRKTGLKLQISVQDIWNNCAELSALQTFEWIKANGFIEEKDCPWRGTLELGKKRPIGARVYKMIERVSPIDPISEYGLACCLTGSPIFASLGIGKTFVNYNGGFYDGEYVGSGFAGTHAIVFVGVGLTSKGNPFWIGQNSWGREWGIYGYFYLPMLLDLIIYTGAKGKGSFYSFIAVIISREYEEKLVEEEIDNASG